MGTEYIDPSQPDGLGPKGRKAVYGKDYNEPDPKQTAKNKAEDRKLFIDAMKARGYDVLVEDLDKITAELKKGEASPTTRTIMNRLLRDESPAFLSKMKEFFPRTHEMVMKYRTLINAEYDKAVTNNASTSGDNLDLMDEFMRAFSKPDADATFKSAIGMMSSQQEIHKAFQATFNDRIRGNVTPDPVMPWECRIGSSRFVVPPININVSQDFRTGSLTGAALRQPNSPKFNSGHSETVISMTLYFPNEESIWGIDIDPKYSSYSGLGGWSGPEVNIDFDTEDESVIDGFLSSLRGLITQFKYAPFLPIKNDFLNRVFGITGVVMHSMSVSTLENYPFCVAVNLQLLRFNHKVYLPMITDFNQAIHWGKYRQYMGRAASWMAAGASKGFLVEKAMDKSVEVATGDTADTYMEYDSPSISSFNPLREFESGKYFDIYYPERTPARVFAPDLSDFRSQGEDETSVTSRNAWQGLLDVLSFGNLNIDTNPNMIYDNVVNYSKSIISADLTNKRNILLQYLQVIGNLPTDRMDYTQFVKFVESQEDEYSRKSKGGRGLTEAEKQEIYTACSDIWFYEIFSTYKNTPFFQAYLRTAEFQQEHVVIHEWEVPMLKLEIDWDSVIVNGVSVNLANNIARMQLQLQQEPVYQHIGGRDSSVDVSLTVFGESELVKFRRVFEHINGLARLEHAHGVLGFLGIKNSLTALCGIKYILPISFQVDTIPGYPHVYNVRLSMVDFDVMQQKRENISSDQQRELIEEFGKRNPFLRIKQRWSTFSAYPDFPLSIRDENDKIVGQVDPDFYFRGFETIDDEVARLGPKDPPKIAPGYAKANYDMEKGHEVHRPSKSTSPSEQDAATVPVDIAYENIETLDTVTKDYNHNVKFFFPYGDDKDTWQLLELGRNGLSFGHQHVSGKTPEYVGQDLKLKDDIPDVTLQQANLPYATPFSQQQGGFLPGVVYADGTADPSKQFELMMLDSQYRDIAGRMVRAFPTYMLWLIDEGGNFGGVKLFDNFYGLQSIIDFSIVQSEDILGDTLVLRVSNLYSKLTSQYKDYIGDDRTDPEFDSASPGGNISTAIDLPLIQQRNLQSGTKDNMLVEIDSFRLRPGVRVHLRVGYSANPNALQPVFNGTITDVQTGDIMTITAQSDAIELAPMVNTTSKKGHSGKIDGAFNTGLWLSEPRDLMVRLLSMGSSTFKESIAHSLHGTIFSENKFGIRHFGQMLYAPLSRVEQERHDKNLAVIKRSITQITEAKSAGEAAGAGFDFLQGGYNVDSADAATSAAGGDDTALATAVAASGSTIRNPVIALMTNMWAQFFQRRDYEIFKRNIYPGNGLGVAQFLGGDLIDGGLAMATAADMVNTDGGLAGKENPAALALSEARAVEDAGSDDAKRNDLEGQPNRTGTQKKMDAAQTIVDTVNLVNPSALGGNPAGFAGGVFSLTRGKLRTNPFMQMLNLASEIPDDDLPGFDEVSFRAQTYMKSVWDLFQLCAALLPNYIVAVRPFEDRSTVFYGKPHWLYTSGVIPLTTGIPKKANEPAVESPDKILNDLTAQIAKIANPLADLESDLDFYKKLGKMSPTASTDNVPWAPTDIANLTLTDPDGQQIVPVRKGKVGIEMHLPAQGEDVVGGTGHIQSDSLPPELKWPWYMDRMGGPRGGAAPVNANPSQGPTKLKGESASAPGKPGAMGILAPEEEQWYMNMRWLTKQKKKYPAYIKGRRIIVVNEANGKACVCTPGDWGPGGSNDNPGSIMAGLSPDTYHYLECGSHGTTVCWFGVVPDNTKLGPVNTTADMNKDLKNTETDETTRTKTEATPVTGNVQDWFDAGAYPDAKTPAEFEYKHGATHAKVPVWISPDSGVYANNEAMNIGDAARKLYDKDYHDDQWKKYAELHQLTGDAAKDPTPFLGEGGRKKEEAEDIWYEIRSNFKDYGDTKDIYKESFEHKDQGVPEYKDLDHDGNDKQVYTKVANDFLNWLWTNPWRRAWVVIVVSRKEDDTALPVGGWDLDIKKGNDWNIGRVQQLFAEWVKQYNPATAGGQKDEYLESWMRSHAEAGYSATDFLHRKVEEIDNVLDNTVGKLLTAVGSSINAVIHIFRMSLQQLGQGMNMIGTMQKQANLLNAVFNDSIYYAAGSPGSLMRLVDNPFTREYGEPVVEVREPFQRMHYLDSFQHILDNSIRESTTDVATVVTASSDGKYPVSVYLDRGAPSERQVEMAVETGLFWDNMRGSGLSGVLHPLIHPVETARGAVKIVTGSNDELMSKRVGLYYLKESLKDIYTGEIIIVGNPDIRPHDLIYLSDVYTRTYGMFEVEQVVHQFTPETGFITSITPNAIVTINDPARWSMVSWAWSWWAVHNLRKDVRHLMDVQANESSAIFTQTSVTPDELAQALQTQMRGHVQYTQGASALVKDLAASSSMGLLEAGVQRLEAPKEANVGATMTAGVIGSVMPLLGDAMWGAWKWVRDNLLDQHGCYIQYLNRDGTAMDAGLSYNQGVAVGRHHSNSLLPNILGVSLDTTEDGHKRITTNDLLRAMGWKEIEITSAVRDISWWVNQTNSGILKLAGQQPNIISIGKTPIVMLVKIHRVVDGDTMTSFDPTIIGAGGEKLKIRFLGIDTPELRFKGNEEDPYSDWMINSANNRGRLAAEYLRKRLIYDLEEQFQDTTVALRIDPDPKNQTDKFGRRLATIFHNVPAGVTDPKIRRELLEHYAKSTEIEWDSYMDDSRPYTMNWELVMTGYAHVDMGGLAFNDKEHGAHGLGKNS